MVQNLLASGSDIVVIDRVDDTANAALCDREGIPVIKGDAAFDRGRRSERRLRSKRAARPVGSITNSNNTREPAEQDGRPACGAARFDRLVAADKDRGTAGQPKDILLAGADPRAHVGAADGFNTAGTDDRAAGRAGLEDRRRTAAVNDRRIGHAAGRNDLQPGSLDRGAGSHAAHVLLAADLRCGIDAADKFGPAELDRRAARPPPESTISLPKTSAPAGVPPERTSITLPTATVSASVKPPESTLR